MRRMRRKSIACATILAAILCTTGRGEGPPEAAATPAPQTRESIESVWDSVDGIIKYFERHRINTRAKVAESLMAKLASKGSDTTIQAMFRLLEKEPDNPIYVRAAAKGMGFYGGNNKKHIGRMVKWLQKHMDDSDPEVAGSALQSYAALLKDDALPRVRMMLNITRRPITMREKTLYPMVVRCLTIIGTPAAREELEKEFRRVQRDARTVEPVIVVGMEMIKRPTVTNVPLIEEFCNMMRMVEKGTKSPRLKRRYREIIRRGEMAVEKFRMSMEARRMRRTPLRSMPRRGKGHR